VDAGIDADILKLNEILQQTGLVETGIPIIGVLTHVDELDPADLKKPADYDEEKLSRIEDAKQLFRINVQQSSPLVSRYLVGVEAISGWI
jgi:hypothetical protein